MAEHLAIKTDHPGDWTKKKSDRVAKALTPRESDAGRKSSWAHTSSDDSLPEPEILAAPEQATCKLHALALFMFAELRSHPESGRRSRITGVSVLRDSLPPDLVEEDRQPHPIPAYDVLHRSLKLEDPATRAAAAQEILDRTAFNIWGYTRDELAELLDYLVAGNHIAPSMVRDAQSLLAQWLS